MITEFMRREIDIVFQSRTELVVRTERLIDTLFYMQSLWRHLDRIDDTDQLLYYYR